MGIKPKQVELQIDKLVLKGFGEIDPSQVSKVVEQELSYLLVEHALFDQINGIIHLDHIDGGSIDAGSKGVQLGKVVAQAIIGEMK